VASRQAPDLEARARARETQRRLTRSSGPARAHLAITAGLGVAATGLVIAQATLFAHVIVRAFLGGDSLTALAPDLAWLAAVSLMRGLVDAGFEATGRIGAARVMAELRARLVRHLLHDRPGALQSERSGELAAAAVQGVDALEHARKTPGVGLGGRGQPLGDGGTRRGGRRGDAQERGAEDGGTHAPIPHVRAARVNAAPRPGMVRSVAQLLGP